jgi:hypothetical protein
LVLGQGDVADVVVAVVDFLQHAAVAARLAELAVEGLRYAILKERSGMEFDARGKRRWGTFWLHSFFHECRMPPSDDPEFGL